MKKTVKTEKRPIKLWLDDIEAGALEQAKNLANLPFIFRHIAVMPDAHVGYGMILFCGLVEIFRMCGCIILATFGMLFFSESFE